MISASSFLSSNVLISSLAFSELLSSGYLKIFVVTATYELGEGMYGKIGVVGPKRMDYEKVVGTLKTLMAQLDEIFKKK